MGGIDPMNMQRVKRPSQSATSHRSSQSSTNGGVKRQSSKPKAVERLRQATGRSNSVVSSILGSMYTPSTQASLSERLGGGTEVGTRRSDRSQRPSHSATSHKSSQSYAPSSCYTDDHVEDDENPTTAEVVLAKKQLKMEAMIRKLLVQQNQADDTIAQLSDSLSRLGPSNTHQLTTKHRASSASQKFGQPA